MSKKNKRADITKTEMDTMMAQNPDPGDVVCMIRNHPHTSKTTPFLHIDLLYFLYVRENYFVYLGKDHVPVDPD